jgi:transposase
MSTVQNNQKRKKYPSDISRNGWKNLQKELSGSKSGMGKGGRPTCEIRQIINAVFYVVKTGCSWRSLSHDFPHWARLRWRPIGEMGQKGVGLGLASGAQTSGAQKGRPAGFRAFAQSVGGRTNHWLRAQYRLSLGSIPVVDCSMIMRSQP